MYLRTYLKRCYLIKCGFRLQRIRCLGTDNSHAHLNHYYVNIDISTSGCDVCILCSSQSLNDYSSFSEATPLRKIYHVIDRLELMLIFKSLSSLSTSNKHLVKKM